MGLSIYMGKQIVKLRTLGQQWRNGGIKSRSMEVVGRALKKKSSHTEVKANAMGL